MERHLGYLDRGGSGWGTYWTLRADAHTRPAAPGDVDKDRRTDWEAAKVRVHSMLRQRTERCGEGLSNSEIRRLTLFSRDQVKRLMAELAEEGTAAVEGRGRAARWVHAKGDSQ